MIGLVFCLISALGVAFSVALIRADPKRWDNRVFGAMGLLDAFTNAYRGVVLLSGHDLTEPDILPFCGALAVPLGWGSIEFAYSFPFSRPMPNRLRIPVVAATVATLAMTFHPWTRKLSQDYSNYYFFTPAFLVMTALMARNVRNVKGDRSALKLLAAALVVRWFTAIVVYGPIYDLWPALFPKALLIEGTASVVVSYLLITLAILRSQLFSVRGFAGDLLGLVSVGVLVLGAAAITVESALRLATGPSALRVALVLGTLVPVTALFVTRTAIERIVARNVDPERVIRERVLERALASTEAEPEAMLGVIRGALSELGATETRFVAAKELPPSLVARFAEAKRLHLARIEAPELDVDRTVLVRSGNTIHGALAVRGKVSRETVLAATTLADRFALRLDAFALFNELESSRKLATLGSFAAAIAHDIRTPLTSVKMNVQILRKKVELPPDDMEYFDIALEELDRLAGDVNELLDFAKPARLDSGVVDLRDVVADAARATQPAFGERRLSLDVHHGEEPPLARGDALRLRQVIENLVSNAAAASPEGARVEIRTRRESDGRVALDVADEGKGIAAEDLARIFEPFFTTRPDGTGLGLAICDKLVRAHGGEIKVDASPGKGATFTVLLPAA